MDKIVLDLETQKTFQEVGGRHLHLLSFFSFNTKVQFHSQEFPRISISAKGVVNEYSTDYH